MDRINGNLVCYMGHRTIHRAILFLIFFLGVILMPAVARAPHEIATSPGVTYIQGMITLDGVFFSGSAQVSLTCRGANWSTCSDWVNSISDGTYTLQTSSDSWDCCSSNYAGYTWDNCQLQAQQWQDQTVSSGLPVTISLNCNKVATQNLSLRPKRHTIALTVTSGGIAITQGLQVSCHEVVGTATAAGAATPAGSGGSSSVSSATKGVFQVPVTDGTFECSAWCDWNTFGSSCPYRTTDARTTVTVPAASTATTVAATLNLSSKNKTIRIAPRLGETSITQGLSAECQQRTGGWEMSRTEKFSSNGTLDILVAAGTYYCSCRCMTWPCEYGGDASTTVTVGESDTVVDTTCRFTTKDKMVRVKVLAGGGQLRSGVSVNCYSQGGGSDSASSTTPNADGFYELKLSQGNYRCTANTVDWQNQKFSGSPEATVELNDTDTTANVTLVMLLNNATLSGVVTDGSSTLANASVDIQAARVSGGNGVSAGLSALVVKQAKVTGGTPDWTRVRTTTQTDSTGAFSVRLPAGTFSVSINPPWDRRELATRRTEVTITADATTAVAITLARKNAKIEGRVVDTSGNPVKSSVYCSSNLGSTLMGDSVWAETDTTADAMGCYFLSADGSTTGLPGCYSFSVSNGTTYNCNTNPYQDLGTATNTGLCDHSEEGMRSVIAVADEVQTLNFTIPSCACSLAISVVNAADVIASSVNGNCTATPTSFGSEEFYFGIGGQLYNGVGRLMVEEDREYSVDCWFYDRTHTSGEAETATCTNGSGSMELLVGSVIEDAVCGSYQNGDGNPITLDASETFCIHVFAQRGNSFRDCESDDDSYCCNLSEGTWTVGYSSDGWCGYSTASRGSTSKQIVVPPEGNVRHSITLLQTGTITARVLNVDGSARSNASVECCPYCASQEGRNAYQYNYSCGWCQTDSEGKCSLSVGAATGEGTNYCCNSYIPYAMKMDEGLNNPEEAEATAIAGQTVEVVLAYEQPDTTSTITITEGDLTPSEDDQSVLKLPILLAETTLSSPVAFATVDCFSPMGGSFETVTDENGVATCPVTSSDPWYAVANNKSGNALYYSQVEPIVFTDGVGAATLTIDYVTSTPEADSVTVTDAATQGAVINLSDGFFLDFPPGCLGGTDEIRTCTCDTVVTPVMGNRIPVSYYAYRCGCVDQNGLPVTELLCPATFCLPYNQGQVENLGLTENDIECNYFDDSSGAYIPIETAAIDAQNNTFCFTQDHMTDFVVTGNGFLGGAGLQGGDGEEIGKEDAVEETHDGAGAAGGCGCRTTGASGGSHHPSWWVLFFALLPLLVVRRPSQRGLD